MSPLALSVCLRGGQMFVIVDSHHSRLCRSYAAQAALGQPALPTFPCVTNPLRLGLGLCVCLVVFSVCDDEATYHFSYLWDYSVA
jgi:hypothetical protein